MSRNFIEAVAHRRSYYHLDNRAVVNDSLVVELMDELLMTMPSPFNVQSARMVLLLDKQHRELWHILLETLRHITPPERFTKTQQKVERAFMAGHGTILFYEDEDALNHMRQNFPAYADNVTTWSEQSSGMLQFAMWTALEDMGYGASLQHYNPLIDRAVAERWLINPDWRLIAQMPFGAPLDTPQQRTAATPLRARRMVFGDTEKI
jgi:predicted oxidoreductase (fatty acid repression mutant protein)